MPFDRSWAVREAARASGGFEADGTIVERLRAFAG